MFAVEQNTTDDTQQQVGLYYLSNGLNPQRQFTVTKAGVDHSWLTETDFTNDYTNQTIYMLTNNVGDGTTQGMGIDIYRINWSDLQNGQWTKIDSINTSTGNPYNTGGGFLRNQYGNNTPWLPTLQVYLGSGSSVSNSWDLYWYTTHN
ncbi:MAG: hypothetical protein ACYC2R_04975 [Burkholderiales bacterium]